MKCATCEADGQRSSVHEIGPRYAIVPSPGEVVRYWSADDELHIHDGGTHRQLVRCSQGHEYAVDMTTPCPTCREVVTMHAPKAREAIMAG